jgi:hypothetical protein
MKRFPPEFSDLVKAKTWSERGNVTPIASDRDRLRWFPLALKRKMAVDGFALLERTMAPHLKPAKCAIDPKSITGMKWNYSEALPKTMRNSSASLNGARSAATATAREIGLMDVLSSASLKEFATSVSGFALSADPALQIIRYEAGDYVGPHNDHHPEDENLRDGYVDLQITLTGDGVARQYLLYEGDGYFNRSCNVGIASGVAVSMLPFWHQVTPLEVKPGRKDAHRWLLLVSFEIERGKRRGKA